MLFCPSQVPRQDKERISNEKKTSFTDYFLKPELHHRFATFKTLCNLSSFASSIHYRMYRMNVKGL